VLVTKVDNDSTLARRIVEDALAAPLGPFSARATKPAKPAVRASKENAENVLPPASPRRKARGVRSSTSPTKNVPAALQKDDYFTSKRTAVRPPADTEPTTAFRAALIDRTAFTRNVANAAVDDDDVCELPSTSSLNASVIRRMLDWEQERSLMKSILESPVDKGKSPVDSAGELPVSADVARGPINAGASRRPSKAPTYTLTQESTSSRSGTMSARSVLGKRGDCDDEVPRLPTPTDGSPTANSSTLNLLKQSLKLSLNFAEQTFGVLAKRSTPALSVLNLSKASPTRGSWADEVIRAGTSDYCLVRSNI
jgi:hypothetical protein